MSNLTRPTDASNVLPAIGAAFDRIDQPPTVFLADLGYQTSWSDLNSGTGRAQAMKDVAGIVHIDGVITRATTPGGVGPIVQLPPGFKPANGGAFFLCSCAQIPFVIAEVAVAVDGVMSFRSCGAAPAPIYIGLCLSFRAAS